MATLLGFTGLSYPIAAGLPGASSQGAPVEEGIVEVVGGWPGVKVGAGGWVGGYKTGRWVGGWVGCGALCLAGWLGLGGVRVEISQTQLAWPVGAGSARGKGV